MKVRLELCVISAVLLCIAGHGVALEEMTAEQLLQRHLDSIGSAAIRADQKSRVVEGTAIYRVLVGGSGQVQGKAVLASEGRRLHMLLKIDADEYKGERFIGDGKKTRVAATWSDKTRSEFGEFIRSQDVPVREGLIGGVLSTAWPLLQMSDRQGKVRLQGLKKVDGISLYALSYQPRKSSDLNITLFFEPETFRHVRTLYTLSLNAGFGMDASGTHASETQSARQHDTRWTIEERFADFTTVDNISLPAKYNVRYEQELQNGFTKSVEWEVQLNRIMNNIPIDAKNFQID